ncbi:hypothetical protein HPB47_025456, partial [Ixodes persulcatus]
LWYEFRRTAGAATEVLWCRVRGSLPRQAVVDHCRKGVVPVVLLGGAMVPPVVERVLERGPKFCLEAPVDKYSLLAAEGMFTVLPDTLFEDKATLAINKNFKTSETPPAKAKARAVALLGQLKLDAVAKRMKQCKVNVLEIFFSAKTHKIGCPFRAIFTERASWQAQNSFWTALCFCLWVFLLLGIISHFMSKYFLRMVNYTYDGSEVESDLTDFEV